MLEEIDGDNPGAGGVSTGVIHRKLCDGERDQLAGSADHAALNRPGAGHVSSATAPPQPHEPVTPSPPIHSASHSQPHEPVTPGAASETAAPAAHATPYTGAFADTDAAKAAWVAKQSTPGSWGASSAGAAKAALEDGDADKQVNELARENADDGDADQLARENAEAAARRARRAASFGSSPAAPVAAVRSASAAAEPIKAVPQRSDLDAAASQQEESHSQIEADLRSALEL